MKAFYSLYRCFESFLLARASEKSVREQRVHNDCCMLSLMLQKKVEVWPLLDLHENFLADKKEKFSIFKLELNKMCFSAKQDILNEMKIVHSFCLKKHCHRSFSVKSILQEIFSCS